MILSYNSQLKPKTRDLRKNMTDAEIHLWQRIKGKQLQGLQFYRQKPIGIYIVDFYCPQVKLILEIDGGQHYEKENMEKDRIRDEYFQKLGLKVLRFNNIEVLKNIDGVVESVNKEISQ